MESSPLVSVCIPVFNGSKYLGETIQSVLSQSFSDYELLIIDDGSVDESDQIVSEYIRKDPRIRYLKNDKRLGLVGNWNECIKRSHGKWVKFVFQDDVLEPNCIEKMVDVIQKSSERTLVIFCERDFIFENADINQREIYIKRPAIWEVYPGKIIFHPIDIIKIATCFPVNNFFGEPSSFLIHKDVFILLGLFDASFHHICDLEYWLRAGINLPLRIVPEILVHFRVHEQSTSSYNRSQKWVQLRYLERIRLLLKFMSDDAYKVLQKHLNTWPCCMLLKTQTAIYARRARKAMCEDVNQGNAKKIQAFEDFFSEFPEAWTLSRINYFVLAINYLLTRYCTKLKWVLGRYPSEKTL